MALSYCSNFGSFNHQQEYLTYPQVQTNEFATDQLLDFSDNFNYFSSDSLINPLFEFDELFYSDTYTNLLPYLSSPPENLISLSPDIYPLQELESYHYPKRQKCYSDDYSLSFATSFFDGNVGNFEPGLDYWPKIPAEVANFEVPAMSTYAEGISSENNVLKKTSGGGGGLSAQSVAARERRRKITDKTQQLGKLIPGGNKMNTAEMLQAASNYVKFLQSQVQLLQLIESAQKKNKEELLTDEVQILLASPAIQEKLYSQEKCLVPKEFLETVANDDEIQSTPFIIDEIHQLLGSN